MKSLIWIAFDLGVRGDYEGMYEFLDAHQAKECGDNVAALHYEFKNDLVAELKKELSRFVKFERRKSRVYVVFPADKGSYKGRFIEGGRKSDPWTGYAATRTQDEDTDE